MTDFDTSTQPTVPPAGKKELPLGGCSQCGHVLFERQVQKQPERVAIRFGSQTLNYRELNCRTNKIASLLRKRGVALESVVGLCMGSSVSAIMSAIAIHKAGGAYFSLDPTLPAERLLEIASAASLKLVIATTATAANLASEDIDFVTEADLEGADLEVGHDLDSGVIGDSLAFIRYTSGSTGTPKLVANIHRSITNRLASAPLPDIEPSDICALNTSSGFGSRLYFPLSCGASIALISDVEIRDPKRLVVSLERYGVTSIYVVPSLLRQILALGPISIGRLSRMRAITVGGEALPPSLAADCLAALPQTRLIVLYGSNETGGSALCRVFTDMPASDKQSIGRPVVNTRALILDDNLNVVAAGCVGEIYIGSPHLARGYVNDPDATAAAFIPDPFLSSPNSRLFRTGDMGRLLPNGEIEFLGRRDQQVKVRGFRVELKEIEIVLLRHSQIEEAVVVDRSTEGITRLVAYITTKARVAVRIDELRDFLRAQLPQYMLPHSFIVLDELPLNARGKVDRQRLPEPSEHRPELGTQYVPAQTPLQQRLVDIWEDILQVTPVGIHDHFLDLGGDSLVAMQIASRLGDCLHCEVDANALLMRPSIAEMTIAIEATLDR